MFILRDGRAQMGFEPANLRASIINRTGSASLIGEPLMCDIANTAYSADATEGGVFGNGITPVSTQQAYQFGPIGIVQNPGVSSGQRVECCLFGITLVRANSAGALGQAVGNLQMASASRHLTIQSTLTANVRYLGYSLVAHGGTGTETILCLFNGVAGRNG